MTRTLRPTAAAALGVLCLAPGPLGAVPVVRPRVVAVTPHDTGAFTQGLVFADGTFLEGTGLYGDSDVREVEPQTGAVLRSVALPASDFGEGLALVGDRVWQLTWREQHAYERDLADFSVLRTVPYSGEGWGLAHDGTRFVMSDGSSTLYFRDTSTFDVIGSVTVTRDGAPVDRLNELECVGELVYANVWTTDSILRIDPATGVVLTEIDASGLLTPAEEASADVLNGIAFDPATRHFFLTGKWWPKVFEVAFDFNPYSACEPATLGAIEGLRVTRDAGGGVALSWSADPAARAYHVNSVSSLADLPPPGLHRADVPGGAGEPQCDTAAPVTSCVDADAIGGASPPLLFYSVFAACGPDGVDEGP